MLFLIILFNILNKQHVYTEGETFTTDNFTGVVNSSYITNKDLVFHSDAKTAKEKIYEFFRFIAGRAFTMLIEFVGGWLLFQTPIPEMISKCIVTVVVIILNFFISKFFAFKSNSKQDSRKKED